MRRLFLTALVILLSGAVFWAAWSFARRDNRLPGLPDGDQEVAWIHAATSGSNWERFVAGILRVGREWPQVQIDDRNAFLEQTTAVPEVVIGFAGVPGKLHIRWYKLTSETDNVYWVRRLAQRGRAPLAFIGGGTSERAVELARALAEQKSWPGAAPLLLITTATANTLYLDPATAHDPMAGGPTSLMDVYKDRSFRFCFTNRQMAQAVVDFLWTQPDLLPIGDPMPALAAIGEPSLNPWGAVGLLAVHATECLPAATALEWDDDPYSIDLSREFHMAFHQPDLPRMIVKDTRSIPSSVGGFFRPNAWEAQAAEFLLDGLHDNPLERQVLILPASAAPARRVLRAVTGVRPLAGRSLVAVTGDSININNVYRDSDLVWNTRTLPIPLVFFTHQNPGAWDPIDAGQSAAHTTDSALLLPPNGTDDVLLYRDLVRVLVESAFPHTAAGPRRLIHNSEELAQRFRNRQPPFFDASGDRLGGYDEHVVVLRPQFAGGAPVLASATLEIWRRDGSGVRSAWTQIQNRVIEHGRRANY